MKSLRTVLFWTHLCAGLTVGLLVALMALTGTSMAFEKQLLAWAEADVRVTPPPSRGAARLPLAELQARFRATQADARPASIAVSANPAAAVVFVAGRETTFYANPYTGDIRLASAPRLRSFLRLAEECHRWLTLAGPKRDVGKGITGAVSVGFFFLCVSGLYLWWPRTPNWRGFRAIVTFNFQLAGKARDWHWHNLIGFWCLPMLLLSTTTGMIMSYQWANNALYRLAGTPPPAEAAEAPAVFEINRPDSAARPLALDALLAIAVKDFPRWDVITFRLGAPRTRPAAAGGTPRPETETGAAGAPRPDRPENAVRPEGGGERRGPQPATLIVHEADRWPRTAFATLTLNPYTGGVLQRETFAAQSAGRRARFWARYLHTGEALGLGGQILMALGALGASFLVYTGFALAWRRFFSATKIRAGSG